MSQNLRALVEGILPAVAQPELHSRQKAGQPGLRSVGWAFLCIGAVAFGGLGATLALLQRDLVARRSWIQSSDVTEAQAYTKPLPGSTVVQVVTFLGWRMGRWSGAIVATVAFLLPALALMTVAAAAVLVLPGAALWRLARSEAGSGLLVLVLLSAFVSGLFVNAALVVAVAGAVGVALDQVKRDA